MFSFRFFFTNMVIAILLFLQSAVNAQVSSNEYEVKSAFLYNLVKMIDWSGLKSDQVGIHLCFFGQDLFEDTLDSLEGKNVGEFSLIVMRNVTLENLKECQVVYVGQPEKNNFMQVQKVIEALPIVTIGDFPNFSKAGGMINLVEEGQRIKIEVNLSSVQRNKIQISSRLLKLARIIE